MKGMYPIMRLSVDTLIERYKNNLFSAAFNVCGNAADAEDVLQDTFLQYHLSTTQFESEQHIRNWLLRVAINKAKDVTRSFWRRNKVPLEDYTETLVFETPESKDLFLAVMKLPEKYRIVLHLYYYEDYSTKEISDILSISVSNVKIRLDRGRKQLRTLLKEEWDDDE